MRQRFFLLLFLACLIGFQSAFAEVLIVADEHPAMQFVSDQLKAQEGINSRVVWQTNLPPTLTNFQAVIVYIHRDLSPKAERAFIDYAQGGGRLVLLHHSVSSGKRKNKDWFSFIGIALPEGDVDAGGYKWIEGVTWTPVNLNPAHFIMSNKVRFPDQVEYEGKKVGAVRLDHSEVYLNHKPKEPRTVLMGFRYEDAKSGKTFMQNTAGWVRPVGKGILVYLMPGHTQRDFETAPYGRIVLNAVIWDGR
jgi:hypothetical protein